MMQVFKYSTFFLMDSGKEDLYSFIYFIIEIIEGVKNEGGKVFLHCKQGVSRSISFAIAYVMYHDLLSFADAFSFVKKQRKVAVPNLYFRAQLKEWEQSRREKTGKIYRIAYHSLLDRKAVYKTYRSDDPKDISGGYVSIDSPNFILDPRGTYVIPIKDTVYVWHGNKQSAGKVAIVIIVNHSA